MITYRLSDALPAAVAQRLVDELQPDAEPTYRKRIEAYLDSGHGSCALRATVHAKLILDNWLRFNVDRYDLCAWVIMPNHVHVLIRLNGSASLAGIVQSWKSYTGRRLPVTWQREYWDRFIRDENHYHQAVAYIHDNPVKAHLCRQPAEWPWSSAPQAGRVEHQLDRE